MEIECKCGDIICLERRVYEALGAASMCWNPRPDGVFDSTRAIEIGEELLAHIAILRRQHGPTAI